MEEKQPKKHAEKTGKRAKIKLHVPGESDAWRTVVPSKEVSEALADLRDHCFRPPEDPQAPNLADRGCTSATAGMTLVALEALYDPKHMEMAMKSFAFNDGTDVVHKALVGLNTMSKDPEKHRYHPVSPNDTPARDPSNKLGDVIEKLFAAVDRDFQPEVQEILSRLKAARPRQT